jgi:hypothetical protein
MGEWRSIETAPKDGTRFLAFYPAFGGIEVIRRHDPGGAARNPKHHFECWVRSGAAGDGGHLGAEPTHWMPLPEPPQA